ncbi:TPM domain-containing protein [Hoeflea prorocentri]|uniref:TPM domain-containing protein n=1 Tax=Hoeflea prorocentri TaxID=1922333 RepID=A0A9X3ULV0_9HYPH|nr:TPM domain-containing protein [Hoeflea prorocentri]MCY6383215.1 TPM domain-containing protein [Hoeflea prorocentri]MDA5401015.1 TPM domain-containing protein [Hoeflea prorocentri]
MKRIGRAPAVLILLIGLLAIGLTAVRAQDIPPLTGRVVDSAGILPANVRDSLVAKLAAFEQKSSDQVVVATIDTTGEWTIEHYANLMFRRWGLGQAEENNGVLLLVAVSDRQLRIEVGYGLEGTLTDVLSKLIIDDVIVPEFREGDFPGGIEAGVDSIIDVLEGDAAELEARAERNHSRFDTDDLFAVGFFSLFGLFFGGTILFSIFAPIFGTKIGPGRYKWLGVHVSYNSSGGSSGSRSSSWGSSGGFSGGGGSSGGGGASGSW